MKRIVFGICFLCMIVASSAKAQEVSSDSSKLKFMDKIGHWLVAYGMSGPGYMQSERIEFKSKAFAEVYVEGLIDYDSWLFNLLNKITKFRYEVRQDPHVKFEIKFKPTSDKLDNYNVLFNIQASQAVSLNLEKLSADIVSKYFSGKTYTDPSMAELDVESAIKDALSTIAQAVGNELAPDLMVRYKDEVFWNGHEIPVLDEEGNYVELEAIDKNSNPIPGSELTWTNADPFESKGVVEMTDVPLKSVSLDRGEDHLTVILKRVNASQDIRDMLKMILVEVLTSKKAETEKQLDTLKTEQDLNLDSLNIQIAKLEEKNAGLTVSSGSGGFKPLFSKPIVVAEDEDEGFGSQEVEKKRGFHLLRRKVRLKETIRRKVNVVAFVDLVVDDPVKLKPLLEELMKNSGRLIARLILSNDSEGKLETARNIVVEFVNNNIEDIANAN